MPLPVPPPSPYDTLAIVTQQVRTILGDYIQNMKPAVNGTVDTAGTGVTWDSGDKFTYLMNGISLVIGGIPYVVAQVNSPTSLTLMTDAGAQSGAVFSGVIPTGDIFADTQAYVLPIINLAWRKLQEKLDISSHPRLRDETVIFNVPVVGTLDPSAQCWINWTGFFNGVATFTTPRLPANFMSPIEMWERQSNGNSNVLNLLEFSPMSPTVGHLPARAKGTYNSMFDWREDAIYFPGAIIPRDFRISFRAYLPDIAVSGSFSNTVVPLMRCARALAYYAAAEFVEPRGGVLAQSFTAQGDDAMDMITIRESKLLQFTNVRRRAVYVSGGRRY